MTKIISESEIKAQNKKIAFVKGNRQVDENGKNIKAKKKSLFFEGQIVPIIIVDAEKAIDQGLDCIDLETKEPITADEAKHYYVVVDGQHRAEAHFYMKKNGYDYIDEQGQKVHDDYNKELVFMFPLNDEIAISKLLATINTCTSPWKGSELVSCASLTIEEEVPVLDRMAELANAGYSQEAASKWLTFKKVTSKQLTDAMSGNIASIFTNKKNMERGNKLITAATPTFGEEFLKTRNLIDWVIKKYEEVDDDHKGKIIEKIIKFLSSISKEDAQEIVSLKGERGGEPREAKINKKLNSLYNSFEV